MVAIKITKVIDSIGDYCILFGDGKSWYGIRCLSAQEASLAIGMLSPCLHSPKLPESARWSFLLFQDGVNSAWSPPSGSKTALCQGQTASWLQTCHVVMGSSLPSLDVAPFLPSINSIQFSRVWLFATPWTVAYQAPLSMGFSRQVYFQIKSGNLFILIIVRRYQSLLHCITVYTISVNLPWWSILPLFGKLTKSKRKIPQGKHSLERHSILFQC